MNKKVISILIFLVVVIGIGAVSAFDLGGLTGDSASTEDQNVTIDGIDFIIPAGFEEDESLALDGVENESSGQKYVTWGKTYSNDNNSVISIGVATYDNYEVDDYLASQVGSNEDEINGITGYEYDSAPFEGFVYADDGKLVILSVTDESLLEDILVGE